MASRGLSFRWHKVALDTNALIDLEENRSDALHIRTIIEAWKRGQIDLAVIAASASENQTAGVASRDFAAFEARLRNAGLAGVRQLLPLAIFDVFYWDHGLWASEEMMELESKVRGILFPGILTTPPTNVVENSVWRNRMCDVLVAWSCIHHKWECLVTRDKTFHDHKIQLAALGLHDVLYPKDAARLTRP